MSVYESEIVSGRDAEGIFSAVRGLDHSGRLVSSIQTLSPVFTALLCLQEGPVFGPWIARTMLIKVQRTAVAYPEFGKSLAGE